jgi:hypothetical protein
MGYEAIRGYRAGRRWLVPGSVVAVVALALGGWLIARGQATRTREAPEARKVLDVQATAPFQILIPGYLPKSFDRAAVEIDVRKSGPGGGSMVQLTYRSDQGPPLFIREWLPVHPEAEILAASREVHTKWGSGWMLDQDEGLIAIWVDAGALRAAIHTSSQEVVSGEMLLAVADSLGPAANLRVFDALRDPPEVRDVIPPPVEVPVNAEGVQEVDLIVSIRGYSPTHFAVRKGVPVRVTFRQLGWVGCGNDITFPIGPNETVEVQLESPDDKKLIEFTPQVAGEFQFSCTNLVYRGIVTVHE